MSRAVMIAAPASGSGKTLITMGLLRAFAGQGLNVRAAKTGPDYIDPSYHAIASGAPCPNIDLLAMMPAHCAFLAAAGELTIIEAAMGLFDGAGLAGSGSAAALARCLDIPVVLVIDCRHMAHSVRAIVRGFTAEDHAPEIAGIILNRVGSARHEALLRAALTAPGVPPVIGVVGNNLSMALPSRHLGLIPASERPDIEAQIDHAAQVLTRQVDLHHIKAAARAVSPGAHTPSLPPAQRIAIAQDDAFCFLYPHIIEDWRAAGAELSFFSPLADMAVPEADLIYLPGGYPELHAGRISANSTFIKTLKNAAQTTDIYGECGGYMALGEGLIDADGTGHEMAGLLRLESSFARKNLHLGYRKVTVHQGPFRGSWVGHEFHYASTISAIGRPLLAAHDADGFALGDMGLCHGRVSGSFIHLINRPVF